jgi:hypothetical protein
MCKQGAGVQQKAMEKDEGFCTYATRKCGSIYRSVYYTWDEMNKKGIEMAAKKK